MKYKQYLVLENQINDIENFIRDSLSGTPRKTTADLMFVGAQKAIQGLRKAPFMKVWNDLVKEKYLVKLGGGKFKWER